MRHGFYAQAPSEALRILGEDPEEFNRLLDSLRASCQPCDEFQARLVERLARAIWRLERSDRIQDSIAVRQVREMKRELDRLVDNGLQAYDRKLARLEGLAEAVSDEQFVAGSDEFAAFNAAFGEQLERRGEEILTLLYQLLDPDAGEGWEPDAPVPDPELPIATGTDRAKGRRIRPRDPTMLLKTKAILDVVSAPGCGTAPATKKKNEAGMSFRINKTVRRFEECHMGLRPTNGDEKLAAKAH